MQALNGWTGGSAASLPEPQRASVKLCHIDAGESSVSFYVEENHQPIKGLIYGRVPMLPDDPDEDDVKLILSLMYRPLVGHKNQAHVPLLDWEWSEYQMFWLYRERLQNSSYTGRADG